MKETENNPEIIIVLGVYFIKLGLMEKKMIPLDIDLKIWRAIKEVHEFNNKKSSDSDSIVQTSNYFTYCILF